MEYKRLEQAELDKLEKEFIDFLVINGITAEDWEELKLSDANRANEVINQFSDVVWESSLRTVQYLEKREKNSIYCFECLPEKIKLIRVIDMDKTTDLSRDAAAELANLTLQRAEKAYNQKREKELFKMIQDGCLISEGELYKSLDQ